MKNRLLKYGASFCAVEHANDTSFHLLQLQKKKKELVISQEKKCGSLVSILEALGNQKHIFLIVNNELVLSKQIDFTHTSEERIVKSAFPNIALQDFYYEVFQNDTNSSVSICRKEVLDKVVQAYKEKGVSIIDFSLGNLGIKSLLPFLERTQINTSNATIHLEDKEVRSIEKNKSTSESYQINGLEVKSESTLALAGILSYYLGIKKNKNPFQLELEKEYRQKRFFNVGIRASLGFLFVLLLINFFVFTQFRSEAANLKTELELNETYKKQLISLNEVVSKKKKLVESITSASNSRVIWYIDQISKTVPKTLSLKELNYQPLTKPAKEGKLLEFKNDQLVVSGISKNDIDYTEWIATLEEFEWIEEVSFENYGSEKTKRTSFGFVIHIKEGR